MTPDSLDACMRLNDECRALVADALARTPRLSLAQIARDAEGQLIYPLTRTTLSHISGGYNHRLLSERGVSQITPERLRDLNRFLRARYGAQMPGDAPLFSAALPDDWAVTRRKALSGTTPEARAENIALMRQAHELARELERLRPLPRKARAEALSTLMSHNIRNTHYSVIVSGSIMDTEERAGRPQMASERLRELVIALEIMIEDARKAPAPAVDAAPQPEPEPQPTVDAAPQAEPAPTRKLAPPTSRSGRLAVAKEMLQEKGSVSITELHHRLAVPMGTAAELLRMMDGVRHTGRGKYVSQ